MTPYVRQSTTNPRQGDVFVVTYPKCGTNWMQFILYNIVSRAAPITNMREFRLNSPFIELTGAGAAENPSRSGPIMTHLPYSVFRPVDCAKYIYVARNPCDCAVSFYHFIKGLTPKDVTDVLYGDYFDHLLPWYEHRGAENVHLVTYERLKADTRDEVLKVADFLGEQHGSSLRKNEALLQRVLNACSFDNMKVLFKEKPLDRAKMLLGTAPEKSAALAKANAVVQKDSEMHEGSGFIRKRTKEWIEKKTRGSDVMCLWSDCDLP
ncbi:hypothetical protein HPB50_024573 [Hyalomma asiaticum]|uniref:Uncharacterized protein n=1 Tax=Hyalomma asiaticum TaxID=266040 RepID=A0ACB7RZZ9_HYAAI|nr:hypothetical protein HPB50_024573 [Hyalomma asiaticum]